MKNVKQLMLWLTSGVMATYIIVLLVLYTAVKPAEPYAIQLGAFIALITGISVGLIISIILAGIKAYKIAKVYLILQIIAMSIVSVLVYIGFVTPSLIPGLADIKIIFFIPPTIFSIIYTIPLFVTTILFNVLKDKEE